MARTYSNMLALGTRIIDFNLIDTRSNLYYSLDGLKGEKGTLIFFICNHCPFVLHIIEEIVRISNKYNKQGIKFIAISSNDEIQYPEDGPEKMAEFAIQYNMDFPYLYDKSQEVARAYNAACTPDFFLFDAKDKLCYRGQLDDSRPGNNIAVSGEDLRNAVEALVYGKTIRNEQKPSIGCSIKWR